MRWSFAAPLAIAVIIAAAELPDLKTPRTPPEQPIAFSHKLHVNKNGLKCTQCHPVPDPGDFATVPKTQFCMGCHASVKTDSPEIKKLAAFHADGKRVPWIPLYRVPEWVSFNHKQHLTVQGVSCESCHGKVSERDALAREKDISMAACMDCHRAHKASNDCLLCHDHR